MGTPGPQLPIIPPRIDQTASGRPPTLGNERLREGDAVPLPMLIITALGMGLAVGVVLMVAVKALSA